ncbi:ribosome hibernation-promoting factor, HPF/YfiA family [Luteitalea sp.]
MRLALTGRNLTITPALRQVVTTRLEKLDRLLHGSIISAQVALQVQKDRVNADVRVTTRGDHDLSGHGQAPTARASVTAAIAKVEHQAEKVKGRLEARKRRPAVAKDAVEAVVVEAPRGRRAAARAEQEAVSARVIRVRRPSAKPMLLEDALPRLGAAPGSVVVFRDAALERLQVLVRRADGHIALVDADA